MTDNDDFYDAAETECQGYGDFCGTRKDGAQDLCPDCFMVRLDSQSPRLPR